jgi:tectonic-1/3
MNSCDVNCCCDDDCSDNDRLAFSGCGTRTFDFDSHHCYETHFVYHNNTEFKFVQNEDGLFCIVKDNLPERFTYQNRKVGFNICNFSSL